MATRLLPRVLLIHGKDDLKPEKPKKPEPAQRAGGATLVFHCAAREDVHDPNNLVALLDAEGIRTGTIRVRNPIGFDQWFIPITSVGALAAGVPYAKALASDHQRVAQGAPRPARAAAERQNQREGEFSPPRWSSCWQRSPSMKKEIGPLQVAKAPKKKAKTKTAAKRKKKT